MVKLFIDVGDDAGLSDELNTVYVWDASNDVKAYEIAMEQVTPIKPQLL